MRFIFTLLAQRRKIIHFVTFQLLLVQLHTCLSIDESHVGSISSLLEGGVLRLIQLCSLRPEVVLLDRQIRKNHMVLRGLTRIVQLVLWDLAQGSRCADFRPADHLLSDLLCDLLE